MSQAEMDLVRPDHPWLGEFERNPEVAFDRIVRGVARIPPYGRADALTVIPSLFEPLDPADPLLSLLDRAAQSWIDRWRRKLPEERVDYGFKRYVRDAVTALRVPQLVILPETRTMLREAYFTYLRWAEPLVLGTSLDPRSAFWLALAEEQPDLRFESLWQRICRQTGEGLYPLHYLSIGLLGLRRLPIGEDERLQRVLGGLAAWAAGLPDQASTKREFCQQVRMLRWLFPLPSRSDWWERVEPLLIAH